MVFRYLHITLEELASDNVYTCACMRVRLCVNACVCACTRVCMRALRKCVCAKLIMHTIKKWEMSKNVHISLRGS